MSQALSQSATELSFHGQTEENWNYTAMAKRASDHLLSKVTMTRERASLNRQALIDTCKNDYRMHFAGIYGKDAQLPSAVFAKITEAVESTIAKRLNEVNALNAVSYRRSFAFKPAKLDFVDRITIVGENVLALAEKKLACTIAITANERKLTELQKKPTPDLDREKQVKEYGVKLELAKAFILKEIEYQDNLAKETK